MLLILTFSAGCAGEKEATPPIAPHPSYETTTVQLPGCDADVPLARDPEGTIRDRIDRSGDSDRICLLLKDLKSAMQQGLLPGYSEEHWSSVQSFDVSWRGAPGIRTVGVTLDVSGPQPFVPGAEFYISTDGTERRSTHLSQRDYAFQKISPKR